MDLGQRLPQGWEVHRPPSQQSLELSLEGLDPDADPGHPRIPQNAQDGGHHILRVQLHPDALGDDKMRLDGFHHLFQPAGRQRRRTAAEVEAGDPFPAGELTAHQVDLLDQPVQIAVADRPVILDLAIRAEAAQLPAKRDMHIQSQPLTLGKGQLLVVFILKEKGLGRAGQPHPRQVCDDTDDARQIYFR